MSTPKQTLFIFSAGFACCILLMLLFAAKGDFTTAATPQVLSYHGNLTDANGVPIQGVKTVTFRLYDAPEGGAPLWEETQTVTLKDGQFHSLLGTATPFDASLWSRAPLYLGIQVEDSPELTPRQVIASVVHALTAQDANTVEGKTVADIRNHTLEGSQITSAVAKAVDADTVDGKHAAELMPPGGIIMWSGSLANIPAGWALCDGRGSFGIRVIRSHKS